MMKRQPVNRGHAAIDGAVRKGREAFRNGIPRTENPYPDKRGGQHGEQVTFSRAFQNAWERGWDLASRERQK